MITRRCHNSMRLGCLIGVIGVILFVNQIAWSAEHSLHQLFDDVLRAHVVDGQVSYPDIGADAKFMQYIKEMKGDHVYKNQKERLAYWINAYNALAIQGILDGRSPRTLFGRFGYFKSAEYKIGGKEINLYDLERDVMIPLGELRIHFAINCASVSCPKLASAVYTADKLEEQLDASTRAFINDPSRNRFDRDKKVAYLSKIFRWFKKDFSQYAGSVQKYVARYVDDPDLAHALENERYKVKYLKYDWHLNGTPLQGQG
ncbi:MAG: DUF547 domain-containing protein [Candidatus Tectomicrobia bacterium]